ncbi:MAG TPA: hypothetical protein VIL46_00280 [Gemmataceae bacterium]
MAHGLYHCVLGLCALPASLLCAGLWYGLNYHVAFAAGTALALAAVLLLPWALPRRLGDTPR